MTITFRGEVLYPLRGELPPQWGVTLFKSQILTVPFRGEVFYPLIEGLPHSYWGEDPSPLGEDLPPLGGCGRGSLLELDKEETQGQERSKKHLLEMKNLAGMVTGNGTQHKETVRGNSVVRSRVSTLVRETEENFAKLLFVQSRLAASMRHTGY
mgnify:CR=1 FL=1